MAGTDLSFACNCGELRGTLIGVSPTNGTRAECYCHDCRAAELYAGQPDPAPGGVQLYQTVPDRVQFDSGADQLAVFSLSSKGLLQWQARCCGAVLFKTMRTPKVPFASFRTDRLEDDSPLGPVVARAFVRKANGKRGHEGGLRFMLGFAKRALSRRITGKWKTTPFFDADGTPSRDIHVVPENELSALYAKRG